MDGFTLRSKAIAFAICAGTIVFILALVASSAGRVDVENAAGALTAAIVCGVMCWASAERTIAATAGAIDAAIARLAEAANGDFTGEVPPVVDANVPQLARAMDGLFAQIGASMDHVHRLAMFDTVTGLPNRTHFRRSCERMLAEMAPDGGAALFFIDLDRFKAVNDTMGHASGDMLLAMVANRLRAVADRFSTIEGKTAGAPPLIGRLAGDEFTIFMEHLDHPRDVARVGQAILYALSEPFSLGGQDVEIGASVGVAVRPTHGVTLTDLMRAADAAMYFAKAQGRGRVERFSEHLAEQIAQRARLESDLRSAVDRDEFSLVFQPQIDARNGRIVAAEALLRWQHPEGERLPGAFIQRAEETGLIVEIGEWVIDRVAETLVRWRALGIEQRLSINISPRQLDHASFFRGLRNALHQAGASAHMLELEITESLAMHCSDDVIEAITALRSDGAAIAIDDFGTGYSNLARLRDLPVDRVKLDRSLIEHVVERAESRTIVHAVISLIHGLGCQVVAEGIESAAQAEVLRISGCDVLQGYAIGGPMGEAAFLSWVSDRRLAATG